MGKLRWRDLVPEGSCYCMEVVLLATGSPTNAMSLKDMICYGQDLSDSALQLW